MKFKVELHRQLLNQRGELVAGGGECVAADHPAVLALPENHGVGFFVDDEPVSPSSDNALESDSDSDSTNREAPKPRRFGWNTKSAD